MVGGGGRVGQDDRRLALGEEAIGLAPAGRDGEDAARQLGPLGLRLVAEDRLHPQKQAKARRRGARVLDHDLLVRVARDEIGQAFGRLLHGLRVVDEGEIGIVEGHERVVREAAGNLERRQVDLGRREEAGRLQLRDQFGREAQRDVGLRALALQLQPVEDRHAVVEPDEAQVAAADRLESRLDAWARAPVGREALIGVDGEDRPLGLLCEAATGPPARLRKEARARCAWAELLLPEFEAHPAGRMVPRNPPSLRRYEPDQVRRVGASPLSPIQAPRVSGGTLPASRT